MRVTRSRIGMQQKSLIGSIRGNATTGTGTDPRGTPIALGSDFQADRCFITQPRHPRKLTRLRSDRVAHPGRSGTAAKPLAGKALSSRPSGGTPVIFGEQSRVTFRGCRRPNAGSNLLTCDCERDQPQSAAPDHDEARGHSSRPGRLVESDQGGSMETHDGLPEFVH